MCGGFDAYGFDHAARVQQLSITAASFPRKRESICFLAASNMDSRFRGNDVAVSRDNYVGG